MGVTVRVELDIHPTPAQLAAAFCELDDEGQAQFFIETAAIAKTWPSRHGGATYQWHLVGRHLATCACSTFEAREMVRDIAGGVDTDD